MVDLLLLADLPGVRLFESASFVFRDLENQRENLVTQDLPDVVAAVGIGDVLEVVVQHGSRQDFVTGPEAGEDAHGGHQVGDVGDPIDEKDAAGAVALRVFDVLAELVVVTAGGKPDGSFEQRREQAFQRSIRVGIGRDIFVHFNTADTLEFGIRNSEFSPGHRQ